MQTNTPVDLLGWAISQGPITVVAVYLLLRLEGRMTEVRDAVRQLVSQHQATIPNGRTANTHSP